ncbi:MAG: DUF4124 domain-containing protein [Luteimonas sp.]
MRWLPSLLALLAIMASACAQAQQVVIYRCTDATGHVTLQNDDACPAGTKEQKQVIDTPAAVPAFVPPELPELYSPPVAAKPAKPATTSATAVPIVIRSPPPALFQCRGWDQVAYYTEATTPKQQCAPLQVVGIDGVSPPQASACEMVADQCTAITAEDLCPAWRRRVDEAEFRWRFAGAHDDDERKHEYEALLAAYAGSDCNARP